MEESGESSSGARPITSLSPLEKRNESTLGATASAQERIAAENSLAVESSYSTSTPARGNLIPSSSLEPLILTAPSEISANRPHNPDVTPDLVRRKHRISAALSFQLFSNKIASSLDDRTVLALSEAYGIDAALYLASRFGWKITDKFAHSLEEIRAGIIPEFRPYSSALRRSAPSGRL